MDYHTMDDVFQTNLLSTCRTYIKKDKWETNEYRQTELLILHLRRRDLDAHELAHMTTNTNRNEFNFNYTKNPYIYLIAESVMLGALKSPSFPSTFQTAPLYVAMPFASMRRSG